MKFLAFFACAAAIVFSAASAAAPLLTPAELNALKTDPAVRIVDIRSGQEYGADHIPGAVSAPYGLWRGPATNPGEVPSIAALTALVRSLGLGQTSHAVVVSSGADATDFGASARVYWTLKYLGLNNLSILNGGVKAWADAGLPQDGTAVQVAASSYRPVLNTVVLATQDQVLAQIGDPHTRLIDARPLDFFEGKVKVPAARRAGTIRTAISLSYDRWFVPGTSLFVPIDQARKIAARDLPRPSNETISFCNSGHWSAIDWFALSEVLGEKNIKLYPASIIGWTQAPEALPMDNVPGHANQIPGSIKKLIGKVS